MLAILTTAVATTAFAAGPIRAGDGPATAVAPSTGATVIPANSWQWYIFEVQIANLKGEDRKTTVDATLTNMDGRATFQVWSMDNLATRDKGDKVTPLGEGTENRLGFRGPESKLPASTPLHFWEGGFTEPGLFYLIVKNDTAQPVTYTLNISGKNVVFPSSFRIQ